MCSEEFKLAEEDLPFLCWANDFLASLYNQGGEKRGGGRDKEIVSVCACVCDYLSVCPALPPSLPSSLSLSLQLPLSVSDS